MKNQTLKAFPVLIILSFLSIASSAQGFLRVKGKQIVNDSNKNFILRGIGLGGFMLQEGYMFHLGFLGQQYKIKEKITELIGKEKTDDFYKNWLQYNTQRADVDSLAAWGFNSIRLPMHYNLFTLSVKDEPVKGNNTWLKKGFEMVDSLLEWCKENKIYLILDLHAAPGGQGDDLAISDRNPAGPSLWQSGENKAKTIALWKKLAERYSNEPYIGGYDILNETNWGFDDPADKRGLSEKTNRPLKALFIEITSAIRSVDKNHIIFLEGNGFGNNYNGIFPLWDDNLVISFHKYGNFSTQETIQKFLDYRDQYNVPVWLGESGENSNTWFTNNIKLMEDNGIGWCWWQLKKMGINNPLEIKEPKDYHLFVDFCAGKIDKPDERKSAEILNDLLTNVRIENNIFHKDVIDAMFRQVHSTATIPFKTNLVTDKTIINAVDFDMGRNNFAYSDADTASYMYTPGVNTQGNRGRKYRNDGVDIKTGLNNEPYVFNIENGEWLLFTINVSKAGQYEFVANTSGESKRGLISLFVNNKLQTKKLSVLPAKSNDDFIASSPVGIRLSRGINKIKIYFVEGGFDFKSFQLSLKK
ncbi:MAG TPA: cellulase family glycosylhydrolase [Hanamia sp.]|nr:cellulase family glycosylhydrolase [Hanamia sp.]